MPTNNDFISNLLEIKDLIVTNIENTLEELHIHFHLQRKTHTCPCCGAVTDKVHDYRLSTLKDSPILGRKTFLHYKKRRYQTLPHHKPIGFSGCPSASQYTECQYGCPTDGHLSFHHLPQAGGYPLPKTAYPSSGTLH